MKTNVSGYIIDKILSQLTSNNLSQYYWVIYYLCKLICIKTCYKILNSEFSAIIESFKIEQPYLKDCKHKFQVLTDYFNLFCLMYMKNLRF